MKRLAALALVLVLFACSGPGPDAERVDRLEAQVKSLEREGAARDKALREELARVRGNLEDIRALLEADKDGSGDGGDDGIASAPSDEELDAKAKSFVGENLDRLMELTRKLLDKMESQLDDTPPATGEPPATGDEI